MRFFLIVILFIITLSSASAQDTLFVYAESGLTLRKAASTDSEKLDVIPFGARVVLTGVYGDSVSVTELPSVPFAEMQEGKSLAFNIRAPYREVTWKGQTGYVYGGYLSKYVVSKQNSNKLWISDWLKLQGNSDTLVDGRGKSSDLQLLIHFGNDICYREEHVNMLGRSTIILPHGNLIDGYLVANHLYGLEKSVVAQSHPDYVKTGEDGPILVEINPDKLYFLAPMGDVSITVVGGMVIISAMVWC